MSNLAVLDHYAAGIDVGSEWMHVSVAGGPPEVFGSMTAELHRLCAWLCEKQVRSVAVEATGVYWLCLYEVLEAAGIKVFVVNGRHVRNLPGRKTDMKDCQWLATLHSHGLLRSGFVPPAHIRRMQDYMRLRQDHIAQAASHVQHMQKALERMNLKPHDVIRSLKGVSGMRMMRAIVAGERDAMKLVQLCDTQIRDKKAAALAQALTGTWKDEHVFALRQALHAWDFCREQIHECDRAIEVELQALSAKAEVDDSDDGSGTDGSRAAPSSTTLSEESSQSSVVAATQAKTANVKIRGKARKPGPNSPQIAGLHDMLVLICGGKDATALPGLGEQTLLELIAEVGIDLSVWPTAKHFASWLGLAPGSHQSGKRKGSSKRQVNRAGRLFTMVAMAVGRSVDKGLGGFYRRLKAQRGAPIANKALARKIATLFWQVMVHGLDYVEEGLAKYNEKTIATRLKMIHRLAAQQGYIVVPKSILQDGVIG